jgi:hypothetical protein
VEVKMISKFYIGRLVATKEVAERMDHCRAFAGFVSDCLKKYVSCDWGNLGAAAAAMNNAAVKHGDERIMGTYLFPSDSKFETDVPLLDDRIWIVTECDHSVTTILYPSEY